MNKQSTKQYEAHIPQTMNISDSHHETSSEINDSALDSLLAQHALQPPDNFVAQVMAAVDEQDRQSVHDSAPATQKLTWWQWLAVLAGAPVRGVTGQRAVRKWVSVDSREVLPPERVVDVNGAAGAHRRHAGSHGL